MKWDTLSVVLIAGFVGVLGYNYGRRPTPPNIPAPAEAAHLARFYGPGHYSQNFEEWIIRDFFQDRRGGVFVEVGSGDARRWSNTYYLEGALGWSGLAVEPQASFAPDYVRYRPRTTLISAFASDRDGGTATLHVGDGDDRHMASAKVEFSERFSDTTAQEGPTITLNTMLQRAGIKRIDFLSVDVELHEPQVLGGFDVARYRPTLVSVEAHPEVRDAILAYFTERDYVVLGKYLRVDDRNLWFAPLGTQIRPFPPEVQREWTRHDRH